MLEEFPRPDITLEDFASTVLRSSKAAISGDVLGVFVEAVKPVFAVFSGWSIYALNGFVESKAWPDQIDLFLLKRFGSTLRPSDYAVIEIVLSLPYTAGVRGGTQHPIVFAFGRVDGDFPIGARTTQVAATDQHTAQAMAAWFVERLGLGKGK